MAERERVVVAGAGFAGMRVAKGLEREMDVTLIAPTKQFVYLPLIHEVLSETVAPPAVTRDLAEILPETELVYGRVERLDGDTVVTSDGEAFPFDHLVVAVGAEPNDFGVPGVREHALSFYSVGDALRANATLKVAAAEAEGSPLRVAIVGASFTGVEVGGEVADLLDKLDVPREIVLLDALPMIFPHQGETFREGVRDGLKRQGLELRTEQMVKEVREDALVVAGDEDAGEDAEVLAADVIFWCAGVRPRVLPGVTHQVRDTLQSWDREDVFVVGDAAQFPPERGVPRLAQTAEDQAKVAIHNVLHPDDPVAYEPNVKGLIVSIGHGYAVAELPGDKVFKGKVPWHIKRNLYKAKIRLA